MLASNKIDSSMERALDIAKPRVHWMKNEERYRDSWEG